MDKKYDVLYIHATKNPTSEAYLKYAVMPMGIIGILNSLSAKHIQVLGMNYAIERTLNPEFDILSVLESMDYKVLLTDLHWYEHSFGAMYITRCSKKAHPEVPVVIGGYTTTIFAKEILENFPDVDYAVTGDSELPMEMLVDQLLGRSDIAPEDIPNLVYRRGREVVVAEKTWVQTTLDDMEFVNTDFFEHEEYIPNLSAQGVGRKHTSYWIEIARGCRFNCTYCCGAKENMDVLFRRCGILLRSPGKVAADFCSVAAKGIMQVSPSHDLQMFGKAYYRAVFDEIRKTGVKPGLYLECFQIPTKEYIDDIERTFNKREILLVLSPISGNEALRRENGKQFSNEELYEILSYIRSKSIAVQLYYTVNIVGETREQFQDTVFQMRYLRLMMGMSRNNIFYQRIVIDPLAPMRRMENIRTSYNSFMDYYNYCQLPNSEKYNATGFDDGGEMDIEEKVRAYRDIFGG